MEKEKYVKNYLLELRDIAHVGGNLIAKVISPSIENDDLIRFTSSTANIVADNEVRSFNLSQSSVMLSTMQRIARGDVINDSELETLWLKHYWDHAKNTKVESKHRLDFASNSILVRCEQAIYLYSLGYYKRLIQTEPVSLRDQKGKYVGKTTSFTEREINRCLGPREMIAAFGGKDRKVKDNWVALDGKLGGILQHRTISNKKRFDNAKGEGSIVIIAMMLMLGGKDGLREGISLMRGAQVFECYKQLRILISKVSNLQNREPLDAGGVFGIVKEIQLGLIVMYECSNCKIPLYAVNEPTCPRGCTSHGIKSFKEI